MTHQHFPASTLRAYAEGALTDADAIEEHLLDCPSCRRLANESALDDPLVRQVRAGLTALPPQPPRPTRWRRLRVLLNSAPAVRGTWLFTVLATLAGAVAADLLGGPGGGVGPWWSEHGSALLLVAPVLPVLGVALCFGRLGDPAYEVTASTASGGMQLVLWRTLSVLLTTVPATVLVGAVTGRVTATAWLLPCLALTAVTLALGSLLRIEAAAAAIAVGWLVVAGGPLLADRVPVVLDRPLPLLWSALIAVSAFVLFLHRTTFHDSRS
ncbi:zf-HC2 domain-containing protein [Saccharopolyspora erythraea]|uniref:anti-sigma factor family protein n=1 Tax=Saccharopolyspora erythraea TaxID=1836 RepID=UPI001BA43E10|nr:zf-HC2 domain-containing protein [Saccharopolyspora erythraea]QUG99516.1 zf-HC2 domain-containing protein [Saccharopolyspora erythraea]